MSGEKLPDGAKLPPPATTTRIRYPYRLRNALVLTAACGLLYLGTSTWNSNRHSKAGYLDPLESASDGIRHRHKGFGFDAKKAEEIFLSAPTAESALAVSRIWTEKPHIAGSANDYYSSIQQLEIFRKHFGIKSSKSLPVFDAGSPQSRQATLSIGNITEPTAWVDTYYPVLNTPAERKLEILNDDGTLLWSADVEEKPAEGDPAGQWYDTIGAFHGLSKGGDVQGKLVYVGYGRKQDFNELVAAGHNLTGTIALVRYGGVFRGLKIKAAQEAGAIGCLIYSDPRDNGAVTVENGYKYWPDGPALNPYSVQRGSVQFLSMYPGDPTTPGRPAYPNANRTEGTNVPSIPSLPISWANAQVLLKELETSDSIFSNHNVRLLNGVKDAVTPIWNTMAVVPGHIRNEVVVVGNHRDAWVLGAGDPTSGTASMHEITKGIGKLLKKGWKPLRTIVFASWDAEEYGLVGSTEWGEDFADWIQEHVVAYLNVDISVSGDKFSIYGSPSLAHVLRQAAIDIPHPTDKNRTLWDAREDTGPFTGPIDKDVLDAQREAEELKSVSSTGVVPLGSGSDYTVFLQRLGIASSDESFAGTPQSAVHHYHSIWDSQTWMEKYGDPGFVRHVAVAKHLGLVLLRVADSIVLPLNTTQYALELDSYLDRVADLSTKVSDAPDFVGLRDVIRKLKKASRKLDHRKGNAEHRLKHALKKLSHHHKHCACSHRKFAKARVWVKKVFGVHEEQASHPRDWHKEAGAAPRIGSVRGEEGHKHREHKHGRHHKGCNHHGHGRPKRLRKLIRAVKEVQAVNKKLSTFEQGFISKEGIRDREWYRHLGVAPGKWLGYGATTLPALTEAITIEKNATIVAYETKRLTRLLEKMAENLD